MTELDPLLSDSWTCTSWIKPFGFLVVQRKIDLGCQVVILEIQIFSHYLALRASLCLTLASGKFESWMLCNCSTQFSQAISSFIWSCNSLQFQAREEAPFELEVYCNRQVFRSWSGNGGRKTRSSGYRSTFSTGHVYVGVVPLIGKILHQWIGYDWMIYI